MLRFHLLPPEHMVIITPTAAKKATGGIYYERVYGGGYQVCSGARSAPFHLDMSFTVLLPLRPHLSRSSHCGRRRGFLVWHHREVRDH